MTLTEAYHQVRGIEQDRNKVIEYIYFNQKIKSNLNNYIKKFGGSADDAELIFSDMIVQFIKTMLSKADFQGESTLEAYLMGIGKNLWISEAKRRNRNIAIDSYDSFPEELDPYTPEKLFFTEENKIVLDHLLSNLRTNCKEVLMYWANGFAVHEIMNLLKYQSEGMARKKKSQCMKELLDYIEDNPQIKNLLSYE